MLLSFRRKQTLSNYKQLEFCETSPCVEVTVSYVLTVFVASFPALVSFAPATVFCQTTFAV